MEGFIKQVEKVLLELNKKIEKQQELKQQELKQLDQEREQQELNKKIEMEQELKQQELKRQEHKRQERKELLTVYRSCAAEFGAARGEYLGFLLYSIKNAESDHEAKLLRKALHALGKYEEALLDLEEGTADLSDAGYEKMNAEVEAYKAKVKVNDLLGLIKFNNARALFLALEV